MTKNPAQNRPKELAERLKQQAAELGFELTGIAPAVTPPGVERLDDWLAAGYAGQMSYLADRREAYNHPRHVLDGARSVVMLALAYRTAEPEQAKAGQGRVSRYAWGESDYHDIIRGKLHQLADWLREQSPDAAVRCVVDTAPLMERSFAQLAGLGWIGKNTLLLNKPAGSLFFLAALVTDLDLACDQPFTADHCGTCTACLDACPTDAFPKPHVLDASKCISYLTIELRDQISIELREGLGDWAFGCDVCQEVCPWNHRAPQSQVTAFEPQAAKNPIDLIPLLEMDDAEFRRRFRKTPLWRSHREGLARNAAIVLGNHPTPEALPTLIRGLADPHPMVRGACAWSLGRYEETKAAAALHQQLEIETDAAVIQEIKAALT